MLHEWEMNACMLDLHCSMSPSLLPLDLNFVEDGVHPTVEGSIEQTDGAPRGDIRLRKAARLH